MRLFNKVCSFYFMNLEHFIRHKSIAFYTHPSLTNTFFGGFNPWNDLGTMLKLFSWRIQKYYSQVHPVRARKSSPNTFFLPRAAGGIFCWYSIMAIYRVTRATRKFLNIHDFGFFWTSNVLFWHFYVRNIVVLTGWRCP